MGLFTSRHSERESQLELALQGVPFSKDIVCKFDGMGEDKEQKEETSVYVLPVDVHDGIVYGFLRIKGNLSEAPIGFIRKKKFLFKDYFRLNLNGDFIKEASSDDSRLYLPLRMTNYACHLGTKIKDKFVRQDGSPFHLFGIEGIDGIRPLMLVTETDEGIRFRGMYRSNDDKVALYTQYLHPSDTEVREFLRHLRGTRPVQVAVSRELIANATQPKKENGNQRVSITSSEIDWENPKSIRRYLDQYVIGQEDAKMVVSVAFSNYMAKVRTGDEDLPKDNVLLVGPSGVGKTFVISLLAKAASLPMVQTKLTGKSSEGYKGENLSGVFEQLRASTSGEAPYGVIFLDEIDKLAGDEWGSGSGFGPRLQDELIGWLEEATVLGESKDNGKGNYNALNTRNILFVTAGAFQGLGGGNSLAEIVAKRLGNGKRQIGFGSSGQPEEEQDLRYILHKARPEDLIAYGLKAELIGRLPSIGTFDPLSVEDRVRILTEAQRSPLGKYMQLLELKGYKIEFTTDVPEVIVGYCPQETGARALNAICNDLFTEILYEPEKYADDKRVITVTSDLARDLINLYG